MNVKKAIKKIVALGTGLTMIGATIMGATALNLGDYPAPFVQNGAFNGKIVIGAGANPADVLGAIDISASLQAASKTSVEVEGASATATVEGGVLLEDENNQDFNWGDRISSSTIDDQDFPGILADGTLEDDDGEEYDFQQEITVANYTLAFDLVDNDVYEDPVLYLDVNEAAASDYILQYVVDFDAGDSVNWLNLDDSEELEIFGTKWTVKDISTGGDLILYGSDVSQIVSMNNPVDIEVDGETYTLNIVGANTDTSSVHISVNGNVKSMTEGDTKTIDGLKVYVQDVFISNVAGESASAKLFIGSKELNLGSTFGSRADVELDSETMDGVEVKLTGSETAVDKIEFRVDATQLQNPETGEDYDWIALGDKFVDPLFGFEVQFVDAVPDFTASSRDYVDIKGGSDDVTFKFTNHDGTEYEFEAYTYSGSGTTMTVGEDFDYSANNSIAKKTMFILEEDSSSSEPVSRIFEFVRAEADTDKDATFKDIGTGNEFKVSNQSAIADTGVTVTVDADDVISLSAASKNYVYTKSGTKIKFTEGTSAQHNITFVEDEKGVNSDEIPGDTFEVAISYDSTDKGQVSTPSSWNGGSDSDDNTDYRYGVDKYGTYYVQEADENSELELYIPMEDVDYSVFIAPPGSAVVMTGGSEGGTYYQVNPLAVGIAVLDVDAPALGSTPMIVVGGPCANTVAAELMGNPAVCGEGFESGKGIIKYFDDKQAVLVAGYEAMETQGASRVLADYEDYDLSGNEVEVVVPSLQSITVNKVA